MLRCGRTKVRISSARGGLYESLGKPGRTFYLRCGQSEIRMRSARGSYMNRLFILTDDFQDEDVLGKPMVDFYPLERDCHMSIMSMETGEPVLKKTVIYYTHKKKLVNSLCSTFPLFSRGRVEGVIHFSLNLQVSQRLMERHGNADAKMISQEVPREKKSYHFRSIIGEDSQFKHAINYAKSASNTDFSVLIWAESGCGKELFAQSIHNASDRKDRPFVPINCAAIPDNLLETTLFGTSRGAFTGAMERAGFLIFHPRPSDTELKSWIFMWP